MIVNLTRILRVRALFPGNFFYVVCSIVNIDYIIFFDRDPVSLVIEWYSGDHHEISGSYMLLLEVAVQDWFTRHHI